MVCFSFAENAYMTARGMESDVYSYGVVLLELITRRKPSDSSFMEEIDIVGWVRSTWSKTQDINAVVDSSLVQCIQVCQILTWMFLKQTRDQEAWQCQSQRCEAPSRSPRVCSVV